MAFFAWARFGRRERVQGGFLEGLGSGQGWCSGLCQREVWPGHHMHGRELSMEGKKKKEEGNDIWCMVVVLTKSPMCKTRIATRFVKLGMFKSKGERWRELVMV
jgi:hypothetical protein